MSDNPLYDGILSAAREKAEEILKEAELEAKSVLEEAEEKKTRAVENEVRNTRVRLDAISLKEENAKRSYERLVELKKMDASYNAVMDSVSKKFSSFFSNPNLCRNTLISWIAEAAIGLGFNEARVSYSVKEKVDESMLREAEKLVLDRTGFKVSLSLDTEHPITDYGVLLSSLDSKVYYNNQLDVRMRRKAHEVKQIIQVVTCKAE